MKKHSDSAAARTFIGCICALICEFIYGLSYIFTKQATGSASELALMGWRFLIGALVMTLLILSGVIKVNFKGKSVAPLVKIALFCPCIYFLGETFGISLTTASESGSIIAAIPVTSVILSTVILHRKPYPAQVAGICITMTGVLVTVFAAGTSASFSLEGYVFLLVAVVSYSLYSVFVAKASDYTGSEITYAMLLTGAIFYVILALSEALVDGTFGDLIRLPLTDTAFLSAVIYQGIGCSIIAFYLSNISIAYIGVNRNASFMGIATLVSIFAGVLILGEKFSLIQGIGAVLILSGVYTANIFTKKEG